jgi:hypothetical protein
VATQAQRDELHVLMDYCVAHRGQIHYPPGDRRTETVLHIRSIADIHARIMSPHGWQVDCSQFVVALLLAAGCKVPHPDGYTGTLLADLPHYTNGKVAKVGALVVYGPGTGHHVTMTHTPDKKGGNPLQCSQGQEADPCLIFMAQEAAYQPSPHTFLSIAAL